MGSPATAADLLAMKATIDSEVGIAINNAVAMNLDRQNKLIARLEELLQAGDESMKKQQESQSALTGHHEQAVNNIRELVTTLDDTKTKTSGMEENIARTRKDVSNNIQ